MFRRSLSEAVWVLLFLLAILAAAIATSADAAPAERERTARDHGAVTAARAASSRHSNDVEEPQRALEEFQY